MNHVLTHNEQYKTVMKKEGDKLFVHTAFDDDMSLEQNQRIKNANLLNKPKMAIHDDADMRAMISCPSVFQWNLFKRDNKDTYSMLLSRDESDREKAVKKIEIMHPEWVVYSRL